MHTLFLRRSYRCQVVCLCVSKMNAANCVVHSLSSKINSCSKLGASVCFGKYLILLECIDALIVRWLLANIFISKYSYFEQCWHIPMSIWLGISDAYFCIAYLSLYAWKYFLVRQTFPDREFHESKALIPDTGSV